MIEKLKTNSISAVFHYLSLHKSAYYCDKHDGRILSESDRYTDCLLRLPMYFELSEQDQSHIIQVLLNEK
jgi:dTDP-4-amino-4,6-dideoxygalactose transaminase